MTTLTATVGGTTYVLHDVSTSLAWVGDDGWGMAPTRRITDRGPLQHGDSDIDFRLEPRLGMLKLLARASSASAHWDVRATLLRIFRPSNTAIKLLWGLDNGAQRQIDVHYAGDLTFPSDARLGFNQTAVVQLRASDPTYYDPTVQSVPFGVGGGSGGFVVPVVVPVAIGSSTVNQTQVITYPGTFLSLPIVTIVGPITNPVVTNQSTGEKLDFTGITITAGHSYTIDCRNGYKTVLYDDGTNKIADLTDDSDLQTFHLDPDPDTPGGQNTIKVTGTGANTATAINIVYYVRYVGI
jgi:Phage tail protein